MQDYIYDQFQAVGNDLLRLGLTTSHGGNMSIRHQGNLVATVHFAMLVRGHGCYAVGRTLNEALAYTSALGLSCEVAYLAQQAGSEPAGG
ncbi:MAG: class II aldolase/adducin family protein [Actinomycetota bacterium]